MTTAVLIETKENQNALALRLLVEVAAEAAATTLLAVLRVGAVVALLVLDKVLGNAAHDGATDCSQDTVVGLVAGETAG